MKNRADKLMKSIQEDVEPELDGMIERLAEKAELIVGKTGITAEELSRMCSGYKTQTMRKQLIQKLTDSRANRLLEMLKAQEQKNVTD